MSASDKATEAAMQDTASIIYNLPLMDLLYRAQSTHRAHFDPNRIQCAKLLSIKTGGCPEDCAYCSQSARNGAQLSASKLLEVERVLSEARKAKQAGATRYCMGAAWRSPKERDMPAVIAMVQGVKAMGLETCMTLGMLDDHQVLQLKTAGLDYYNHNIDTSERFYPTIITTRSFAERIETIDRVRNAGINVCSGGIIGMGETAEDRIAMIQTLADMPEPPKSIPINMLMRMPDTPLADVAPLDPIEMVRTVATTRILAPASYVRLSAGRSEMSDELQAMCFFAGANSIFVGDTLLTADNPTATKDAQLFAKLGLMAEEAQP
ncbi:biotin synthase BioB [Paracoccus aestuariivivens]|uniref:Biotin synthase n=2 Tax=Paracoccus aestuariivivens TaxID=1820333 RepID=A0A6L6JCL0_9RHOB|nr:biotin synthase BioB [Paracoccus aestuariivivens]